MSRANLDAGIRFGRPGTDHYNELTRAPERPLNKLSASARTPREPHSPIAFAAADAGSHPKAYTEDGMNKHLLIEAVAPKTGHGKSEVEAVVDSVFATIIETLQAKERVDLRGFDSFVVKEKKARQGRNLRTGETIVIAAKRDAGFKPGKELMRPDT
jgi:nucleoid DNA-binding protein